jgi:hypothetical protein
MKNESKTIRTGQLEKSLEETFPVTSPATVSSRRTPKRRLPPVSFVFEGV